MFYLLNFGDVRIRFSKWTLNFYDSWIKFSTGILPVLWTLDFIYKKLYTFRCRFVCYKR